MSQQGLAMLGQGISDFMSRRQQNQQFQQQLEAQNANREDMQAFQMSQIRSQREYDEAQREAERKKQHLGLIDMGVMFGFNEEMLRRQSPEALAGMAEMWLPGHLERQEQQREEDKLRQQQESAMDVLIEQGIMPEGMTPDAYGMVRGTPQAPQSAQQQQMFDLQMQQGQMGLDLTEAQIDAQLNPRPEYQFISDSYGQPTGIFDRTIGVFKPLDTGFTSWGDNARQFAGTEYEWGGESTLGADCSGFGQCILNEAYGTTLPRFTTSSLGEGGTHREMFDVVTDPVPGDITLWGDHMGVLIEGGNVAHMAGQARDYVEEPLELANMTRTPPTYLRLKPEHAQRTPTVEEVMNLQGIDAQVFGGYYADASTLMPRSSPEEWRRTAWAQYLREKAMGTMQEEPGVLPEPIFNPVTGEEEFQPTPVLPRDVELFTEEIRGIYDYFAEQLEMAGIDDAEAVWSDIKAQIRYLQMDDEAKAALRRELGKVYSIALAPDKPRPSLAAL